MGMRVASFVLTLLGLGTSPVGGTQALEGAAPEFKSAIPVIAMTGPGFTLADLSLPVARQVVRHVAARRAAAAELPPALSVDSSQLSANSSPARSPVHNTPATLTYARPPLLAAGAAAVGALASSAGGLTQPSLTQPSAALRSAPQPIRSIGDHMLTGLVALMLMAYQLRRKHRVLRPHAIAI